MLNYRNANEVWVDTAKHLANPPRGIRFAQWPTFSEYTGGMRPGELTLLCAPTGAGKTQLLSCMSFQLCAQRIPHFVAPVETGDVDFLARIASINDELIRHRIELNNGDAIDPEVVNMLGDYFKTTRYLDYLFLATHDNRVEVHEIINQLKFVHQEHGCQVALLDNLNFFLPISSAAEERSEMDRALHEFVMLVKKLPRRVDHAPQENGW